MRGSSRFRLRVIADFARPILTTEARRLALVVPSNGPTAARRQRSAVTIVDHEPRDEACLIAAPPVRDDTTRHHAARQPRSA